MDALNKTLTYCFQVEESDLLEALFKIQIVQGQYTQELMTLVILTAT